MPFGMLPSSLRAKQALVTELQGVSRFEDIPASPPLENSLNENISGNVTPNGALDAMVRITGRGDTEILIRQAFLASAEAVRPSIVKRMINESGIEINDVTITNPTDTEEPFVLSFRIRQAEFIRAIQEPHITLTPPILGLSPTTVAAVSRWVGTYSYKFELALPERFIVVIPERVRIDDPYSTYRANYGFDGTHLVIERRLVAKEHKPASPNESSFSQKVVAEITRIFVLNSNGEDGRL